MGDPETQAVLAEAARIRGWYTEVADYFNLRTKVRDDGSGGRQRAHRLRYCGRLRAATAMVSGRMVVGIGHQGCRDRMCPSCQAERARQEARLLRDHFDARREIRGTDEPFLFVTLTGLKQDRDVAGLADALDERMASWRRLTNSAYRAQYKKWCAFVRGGLRVVEVTYSEAGTMRRDGTRVAYSGWHPHVHALVELRDPPPGVTWVEWRARFGVWVVAAWCERSPGAKSVAQKVLSVDSHRVGQLCKYVVKPFHLGLRNREVARECMTSLVGRRMMAGFGDWRGWKKEAAETNPKAEGPDVWLASSVLDWHVRAESLVEEQDVQFSSPSGTATRTLLWSEVRERIRADPRTIWAKVRGLTGEGEQEAKDRIEELEQRGKRRCQGTMKTRTTMPSRPGGVP
jgi:hypothetical protein